MSADRWSPSPVTAGPVIVVSGPPGVGKSTVGRLVAATFDRSVHLQADDVMASIVRGWVDPNAAEGAAQNLAVGAALAVSAMSFAQHGYVTVVDGILFPDGVEGLATACAARDVPCHYVVLVADLDTCWARAAARPGNRWPLGHDVFADVHAKVCALDLPARRVVDAAGSPEDVRDAVLTAFHDGFLRVEDRPFTRER